MNRHLKITLESGKRKITAMLFSTTPQEFEYSYGDEVDIAYNLEINEFNGSETVQINLKDIRLSQKTIDYENDCEEQYKLIKAGESKLSGEFIIPSRSQFATVFKHLQNYARMGREEYRYSKLVSDLTLNNVEINYFQLKTIIKVFIELNIISIEELDDFSFNFKFLPNKTKANLDKSSILKKLKYTYAVR
jgi:single-stranded-DNA-specific exonuclease